MAAATARDNFSFLPGSLDGPASTGFVIAPSDTVNLPFVTRGIYVGTAGDIAAVMQSDLSTVLFKNVPVGILPIRATRINATGTAAANMVALS